MRPEDINKMSLLELYQEKRRLMTIQNMMIGTLYSTERLVEVNKEIEKRKKNLK